jgi:hypothetical protein
MHSSRILRSAAEKAFLVPPRTSIDLFASAANAVINLFGSEDKRKLFANSVNSGVILPEILGQANLGYLRILALYDELDSPTLKSFNVDEFLEGVKPALAEFHHVQASLQNKVHVIAKEDNVDDQKREESEELTVEKVLLASYANANDDRLRRVLNYSWKKEVEKDSESDEARISSMVSAWFFESLQVGAKICYFMYPNETIQDGCVEINSVALLSARGILMHEEMEDWIIEEVKEKVTTNIEEDGAEEKESNVENLPVVVAQVEILYNVEQTFAKQDDDDDDENKTESEKTKTVTRASVGVFEGWLNGDPEGNDLRWRVAEIRPAWEFPLLSSGGSK